MTNLWNDLITTQPTLIMLSRQCQEPAILKSSFLFIIYSFVKSVFGTIKQGQNLP